MTTHNILLFIENCHILNKNYKSTDLTKCISKCSSKALWFIHNKQLFNVTGILFEIWNQRPTQLKELSTIHFGGGNEKQRHF